MADIVTSFNRLPRPEYAPSCRVLNHWYFVVRHVALRPTGDIVQIIEIGSRFQANTKPTQILSLPTVAAQADVIVPLLLDTFVKGVDHGPDGRPTGAIPSTAPYSWGTRDSDLARAVEAKLQELGVRSDLCTVQTGTTEQNEIADEVFSETMDILLNSMNTKLPEQASPGRINCGGCRKDSSLFSAGLMKCAGCSTKYYCSRNCQKSDWKQHKKTCGKTGETSSVQQSSPTTGQALDPVVYYRKVAHTVPEAKALADSIKLRLPPTKGSHSTPIRALVITGKDTPQNLELLLGPNWQSISSFWDETRIEVLLKAPVGSPCYVLNQGDRAYVYSPRPASVKETTKIGTIRAIQLALRNRLGERKEPTSQDMMAVLKSFGGDRAAMSPNYQLAVNTMDQGVQVP